MYQYYLQDDDKFWLRFHTAQLYVIHILCISTLNFYFQGERTDNCPHSSLKLFIHYILLPHPESRN